jgi:uncharacterized membrane protein HdeD (DUF308 family)
METKLAIQAPSWWSLVWRGAVAILFGVAVLLFPPTAVAVLVAFFGAYALVDGVLNLAGAVRARRAGGGGMWWSLALEGVVGVACGLVAFFWPGFTAEALILLMASWSLVTGVAEIVAAIRLRKQIEHEWLLGLTGVLSVAFGILLFFMPVVGVIVIAAWIGAYALIFGALLVGLGIRLRSLARALAAHDPAFAGHI